MILLIDYITDWARDTFRPAIIAQLSSLASGRSFYSKSLGTDSAIFSKGRPTITGGHDNDFDFVDVPCTKLGAVLEVSSIEYQLTALRVTTSNVHSVEYDILLDRLTRWDEVLVVLGADLDFLGRIWTEKEKMPDQPVDIEEGPEAEFYAIFEYRCFLSSAWEVIRELSYLAVSKSAYDILVERATFKEPHPCILAFHGVLSTLR